MFKEGSNIQTQNIFTINQRLQIEVLKSGSTEQYHSRIEDISEKDMTIAMPMSKGYPVIVGANSELYGRAIAQGVVYRFFCTLLDKKLHPIPVWIVTLPRDIKKIQQRAFVRIDAILPVSVEFLDKDEAEDRPSLEILTKDISGGGLRLVCKQPIKTGSNLKLLISLPECEPIETTGAVVRTEQPQPDHPIFWVGVKFLHISEGNRSKIIKFIFRKQLEYRQKGL